MYQWEQRTDIEEEVRDAELSRLSTYKCLAMMSAETLATTSTEDERKAVLDEVVRPTSVHAQRASDNPLQPFPAISGELNLRDR